jgi:uncharacterized protein YjbJ (UPF0337 family)
VAVNGDRRPRSHDAGPRSLVRLSINLSFRRHGAESLAIVNAACIPGNWRWRFLLMWSRAFRCVYTASDHMFYRSNIVQPNRTARVVPKSLEAIMKILNRARNMLQISKGKTKEVTGRVTGNKDLESDGANDQHKGHLKQVGEKVKDAIEEL